MHNPIGNHLLVELKISDSSNVLLDNAVVVEEIMLGAAYACKATVVNSYFHKFSPFGVSGVIVISESHLTIHTWPEYNYLAIDIFTCGNSIDPRAAVGFLCLVLMVDSIEVKQIYRGLPFSSK